MNNLEDWGKVPGPFQFSNLVQLLDKKLCQDSSVSFFAKGEKGTFNGKCQLLIIGSSCYVLILITSNLELVCSLHHWTKDTFLIQYTSQSSTYCMPGDEHVCNVYAKRFLCAQNYLHINQTPLNSTPMLFNYWVLFVSETK